MVEVARAHVQETGPAELARAHRVRNIAAQDHVVLALFDNVSPVNADECAIEQLNGRVASPVLDVSTDLLRWHTHRERRSILGGILA